MMLVPFIGEQEPEVAADYCGSHRDDGVGQEVRHRPNYDARRKDTEESESKSWHATDSTTYQGGAR